MSPRWSGSGSRRVHRWCGCGGSAAGGDPFRTAYHDSLKLTQYDDSPHPQTAVFRGKDAGHEGKFELSYRLPG